MTPEEKQLLLKDLSARLPYGVKVHLIYDRDTVEIREMGLGSLHDIIVDNAKGVPYLRSMSSMTEEELKMFRQLQVEADEAGTFEGDMLLYDWLNKNHFDYRLLIFQGLALEAKDGMYEKF